MMLNILQYTGQPTKQGIIQPKTLVMLRLRNPVPSQWLDTETIRDEVSGTISKGTRYEPCQILKLYSCKNGDSVFKVF